jgi:hypothetical protein
LGLLDYYRQFDDMDQEEVNQRLREKRRREKEMELQVVPNLDLSSTEWPDFPNTTCSGSTPCRSASIARMPDENRSG